MDAINAENVLGEKTIFEKLPGQKVGIMHYDLKILQRILQI